MSYIAGGLMALFLWLLLRGLRPRGNDYACWGCYDPVHFEPKLGRFVHPDGRMEAINEPLETSNPIDPDADLLTHWATPVDYP